LQQWHFVTVVVQNVMGCDSEMRIITRMRGNVAARCTRGHDTNKIRRDYATINQRVKDVMQLQDDMQHNDKT
jgi:hypothetical protein